MQDHAVSFGPYRLDPRGGLTMGTRPIRLTPKALTLLCFLVGRPGRVVTKDELFGAVASSSPEVAGDLELTGQVK